MASSPPAPPGRLELPRRLGTLDVATMLVAVTIGAGIYSTPHLIARHVADLPTVLACWLAGGAFVLLAGLVYAEVGSRVPLPGGEYVYLHRAFGPRAGFAVGWIDFFLIGPSARLGLAMVAAIYLTPAAWGETGRIAVTAALIVALCALNYRGVGPSLAAQRLLVAFKLGGLALLVVGALWIVPAAGVERVAATAPAGASLAGIAAAMLLVVFSYLGWSQVAAMAGELRRPARALSRGLLLGFALVVVVYVAVVLAYYRVLGPGGVAAAPAVAAAAGAAIFGGAGAMFVAALVVASTVGSMAVGIMGHSRVHFAMARDGLFFSALGYVHPRFATPSRAIVAHGFACLALLAVRQSLELTFTAMAFGRLVFMALVGLSLFRLRRQQAGAADVFRVPLYPLLPALYLAGVGSLLVARIALQPRETLIDLAVILGALPLLPIARRLGRRPRRLPGPRVVG